MDDLDLHSWSKLYEKSKPVSIFSEILHLIWIKFHLLPQPVGFLKLRINLFCTNVIMRRELCLSDFIKYAISIALCCNTCELIFSKLREATQMFMMVDYVREMTVKKSCTLNMDHLSICLCFFPPQYPHCSMNYIKRHNSRFFTIPSQCHELCPTQVLMWSRRNSVGITCSIPHALYVQHIVCYTVGRDSSTVSTDGAENLLVYSVISDSTVCKSHAPHGVLIICKMLCDTWCEWTA